MGLYLNMRVIGISRGNFERAKAPNDTRLFTRNDFAEVKAKYKLRINNFRNDIKEYKRIVLVCRDYKCGEVFPTDEGKK